MFQEPPALAAIISHDDNITHNDDNNTQPTSYQPADILGGQLKLAYAIAFVCVV